MFKRKLSFFVQAPNNMGRPEEIQQRALRHWGTQFISNQPLQGWEHCGTYLQHVESWIEGSKFPKLVYRYEDMLDDPHRVFRKVLMFLNETVDEKRLSVAIESCRINRLKRLEKKSAMLTFLFWVSLALPS